MTVTVKAKIIRGFERSKGENNVDGGLAHVEYYICTMDSIFHKSGCIFTLF